MFRWVGGCLDKSRNSALETLKRAVNAVRDFFIPSFDVKYELFELEVNENWLKYAHKYLIVSIQSPWTLNNHIL